MERSGVERPGDRSGWIGVAALGVAAVALGVAPLTLDDSYSWIEHTTSESGAQGVRHGWVARTGFVGFGLAVFWISARRARVWRTPATVLHRIFATAMIAVAAFSTEPWVEDVPFDETENTLHSIAATVMGFAFAFGVTAVAASRQPVRWRVIDLIAVASSVVLPLAMARFGSVDGVLQRAMFVVAFVWYGGESIQRDR